MRNVMADFEQDQQLNAFCWLKTKSLVYYTQQEAVGNCCCSFSVWFQVMSLSDVIWKWLRQIIKTMKLHCLVRISGYVGNVTVF